MMTRLATHAVLSSHLGISCLLSRHPAPDTCHLGNKVQISIHSKLITLQFWKKMLRMLRSICGPPLVKYTLVTFSIQCVVITPSLQIQQMKNIDFHTQHTTLARKCGVAVEGLMVSS